MRAAAVLGAGALLLTGCSGVPDAVDDAARGLGMGLDPGRTAVVDLSVGDCFQEPTGSEDEEVLAVATADCADEHDNELLHVLTLSEDVVRFPADPEDEAWLGTEDACYGQVFEDYVGESWEHSAWDVYTFRPTQGSWLDGDRAVHCVLYDAEGRRWTGSPSTGDAVLGAGSSGEPARAAWGP
ncbi:septum formation family protein [Citricoccus sp. SGAir0253]|uniref:septum formation family protein n=1 Tax=Citricoccus sp. SGAir0253 TaxID=2567881 RepID=UPI00143DEFA3|nr:septum formation family protein [Citricoccus sp. SGAir0253]